ncbi:MAG: UDP-N-acetylmuramoyl-tripeptide--D-alanyl-D-alanine ligase [Patescibacteria group bacterium]|nr:UDP-N-acetylmuramoyl-tripeptide--D-alanyl-D-alanine ligase [Patescibacteria group bacterium]
MIFSNLKSHLYALQLLEYDLGEFWRWLAKNPFFYPKEIKGRLGWSPKARFIFALSMLIQLIIPALISLPVSVYENKIIGYPVGYYWLIPLAVFSVTLAVLLLFPAFSLTLSTLILKPAEALEKFLLIRTAQKKLKENRNLTVVGITGSFGKTSVKEILFQMLSVKFKVAATRESHNKIVSVARTVVREVKPETQILIVEMGAYRRGEIASLCRLARPKVGVVTGITSQHLARFETLENIKKAKYELIESLPEDGLALFNLDSDGSRELFEKCRLKKLGYSLKGNRVETLPAVTRFELFGRTVETTLIGRQNALNITGASILAKDLGLREEEILRCIGGLKPIPHRLELIRGANGSIIIDDAYSSNIEGYKAAFETIKEMAIYPKVIVTPGLTEQGKNRFDENVRLAQTAARVFDYAIVVNLENREPLLEGFRREGWTDYRYEYASDQTFWSEANPEVIKDKIIFTAESLNEALQLFFPKITKPGSLILLENDLPDIYR